MCGIAGIVTRDGSSPSEELLRRLSGAIAHRGPDGEGVWTAPGVGLAHRRLAIIDLSSSASQPMHDTSGAYTIVFNGEIYNYRALRDELTSLGAKFRTASDTEVILEAYRAWGVECLSRLHGMFAFALWDEPKKRLVIARDRIGKKPLFFAKTAEGHFAFASEIKAFKGTVDLKPDWNDVRLFLGLQYVPTPRTGFVGVSQLEAGYVGIIENGNFTSRPYHAWPKGTKEISESDMISGVRSRLEDAVKMRMLASDVPVGAFLSGGIDSAAIVAFATKYSQKFSTFTMGFPSVDRDERREAAAIAKKFGTDHHEFEIRPENVAELVELIAHYDAPYADSSALPLWLLAKETSKQIKVVLTGDGGDETFGGYKRYIAYQQALQLASIPLLPRIAAPASLWLGNLFGDARLGRMSRVVEALRENPATAYGEMFCGAYFGSRATAEVFSEDFLTRTNDADAVSFVASQMSDPSLESAMRFDLTSYLPDDLNVKMDRATMRFGLEARAPFLDQELVAFALSLPLKYKVDNGKKKIALKAAMRGILPDEVLDREKRGFQVPLAEWFRGPLAHLVRERVLDPQGSLASIINLPAAERLVRENAAGADHGNRLWMLLSLSTWLSRYV